MTICTIMAVALLSGSVVSQGMWDKPASAPTAKGAAPARKVMPFKKADTDKDRYLTQAEWNASGRPPARWARVDADKDGKVSEQELRAFGQALRAGRQPNL